MCSNNKSFRHSLLILLMEPALMLKAFHRNQMQGFLETANKCVKSSEPAEPTNARDEFISSRL